MHAMLPLLEITDFPQIKRKSLDTLQVNLGYRCNQRCLHCHVNAGPTRTEMMTADNIALVLDVLKKNSIKTLDLTGGAPELNDGFRGLVTAARKLGIHVIDRCNLTILFEPEQKTLAKFLAENNVEVVASLPCYEEVNVDTQRGDGVFDKSILGLQKLNALGYGKDDSEHQLNLVYNPQGASLPPHQVQLEADYKRELLQRFGITFNHLYAVANMPIHRFGSTLISKGQFNDYMALLKDNYDANNLSSLMCRSMVSVDWQGDLYDCDFNQQLQLRGAHSSTKHLSDLLENNISSQPISVAEHCFACTAGQGSSCGGAL